MAISFQPFERYVLVTYSGAITDDAFMAAWQQFYTSTDWRPGMGELNNLSRADLSPTTAKGISQAAAYARQLHRQHGQTFKVAIFAPKALQYGLARAYAAVGANALGSLKVFQDLAQAKTWLQE